MKLSVIVPIYNVEKFLPRCLDSLLRQGMESGEWEVICVNDGSQDNSLAILTEYEQKHPEIFKIIAQENSGAGAAKNAGMKVAMGEFIGFVDSDDYVIDNAYKYILEHYCDGNVDVVHFKWNLISTDGGTLYDPDAKPDGDIMFEGDGAEAYNRQKLPYVWTKLYRRTFLEEHRICFEAPLMEDELFNFEVFHLHPRLRIVSSNVYRYEQGNPTSLLTTIDKEKVKQQLRWLLFVVEKMENYLHEGDGELASAAQRNINTFSMHYYNKMLKAHLTWSEWRQYTRPIKLQRIHQLDASQVSSWLGKNIVYLKNDSAMFYVVYLFTTFLLNVFFTRWIRPRIINSVS